MNGDPRKVKARWHYGEPAEGDWFASARGRLAYRIVDVERIDPRRSARGYTHRLVVQRFPKAEVPEGVVIRPWAWDRPAKASRRRKA